MAKDTRPTVCSRALLRLLKKGGPQADAVRAIVDQSQLSRYSRAQRRPDIETALRLQAAAPELLPVDGWVKPVRGRMAEEVRRAPVDASPVGEGAA